MCRTARRASRSGRSWKRRRRRAMCRADGMVPGNPRFTDADYVRGTFGSAPTRAAVIQGGEEYLAPPTAVANAAAGTPAAGGTPPVTQEFRPGMVTIDGLPLMKPPYGR